MLTDNESFCALSLEAQWLFFWLRLQLPDHAAGSLPVFRLARLLNKPKDELTPMLDELIDRGFLVIEADQFLWLRSAELDATVAELIAGNSNHARGVVRRILADFANAPTMRDAFLDRFRAEFRSHGERVSDLLAIASQAARELLSTESDTEIRLRTGERLLFRKRS